MSNRLINCHVACRIRYHAPPPRIFLLTWNNLERVVQITSSCSRCIKISVAIQWDYNLRMETLPRLCYIGHYAVYFLLACYWSIAPTHDKEWIRPNPCSIMWAIFGLRIYLHMLAFFTWERKRSERVVLVLIPVNKKIQMWTISFIYIFKFFFFLDP